MNNRRKETRLFPSTQLKLLEGATGRLLGNIADFSATGFMLISKDSYPTDVTSNFRIDVPLYHHMPSESRILPNERHIEFEAISLWCRADTLAEELFDVGFQFTKITKDDVDFLLKLYGYVTDDMPADD